MAESRIEREGGRSLREGAGGSKRDPMLKENGGVWNEGAVDYRP